MMAARTSSAESVELLLKKNANPNLLSQRNEKENALAIALKTGNIQIINILSAVTTEGMESCIRVLAESNRTIGDETKIILERLIIEGKMYVLLEEASIFGNGYMVDFLLNYLELK